MFGPKSRKEFKQKTGLIVTKPPTSLFRVIRRCVDQS